MIFLKMLDFILTRINKMETNTNNKLADAAEKLWAGGVYEERDDHLALLTSNGWGWAIERGLTDYCGHTVAVAGRGLILDSICAKTLPSNERLAGHGPAGSAFKVAPEHPRAEHIQRGDIVTVNARKGRPYGSHIVLAMGSVDDAGVFPTIEGNSNGRRADGTMGRGVVKKHRRIGEVSRVYRLTGAHYE